MFYLGIDQHRKQLTVCLRDEAGSIVLQRQVSTMWKPVREFFEQLLQQCSGDGGYVAVVEVCGFNDWLLKLLPEVGCREIVLIQPEKRPKKKTDRRDANRLSELLWVNRQRLLKNQMVQGLRRVWIPPTEVCADRQLTGLRKSLAASRTRVTNRITHILRKHNLQQDCPTQRIQSKGGRAWLKQLALPDLDRFELDLALEHWELLDRQIEKLEERIILRVDRSEEAQVIATLYGCGGYTALALAASIGTIDRFPKPRSLGNYWGLTPGCRNSGEATDRLGSITKQGSATARFLLGQIVVHVLRRDATMREWYQRIKRRRGSKIARVAVMRRLASVIWHMLKKKQRYVHGGPKAGASAASTQAPTLASIRDPVLL